MLKKFTKATLAFIFCIFFLLFVFIVAGIYSYKEHINIKESIRESMESCIADKAMSFALINDDIIFSDTIEDLVEYCRMVEIEQFLFGNKQDKATSVFVQGLKEIMNKDMAEIKDNVVKELTDNDIIFVKE